MSNQNKATGCVVWLTGLSGSGKSTLATKLQELLLNNDYNTTILDGDSVRTGLCSDLGFSDKDRSENIRRVAHVADLMSKANLIVICSLISPFKHDREIARKINHNHKFIEVYVKASFDTCKKRDPKGLYQKALKGEIKNFTGIDSKYEEPINPELIIDTELKSIEVSVKEIFNYLVSYLI